MRIRVLAVGTRMPSWVTEGVHEYQKRLPRDFPVEWVEVPPAKRGGDSAERLMAREAESIRKLLKADERLLVMDVRGNTISTEEMANRFRDWQMDGRNLAVVIGGPDGVDPGLLAAAEARWSLGRITLPHPLVRVVLAEQFYRAWSINAQHPYHRA